MLKSLYANRWMLILVIALIARPAMAMVAQDSMMGHMEHETVHCHDGSSTDCQMSMGDDSGPHHNCSNCDDSCSPSAILTSETSRQMVSGQHRLFSYQTLLISRRNDEPFRPPIHS